MRLQIEKWLDQQNFKEDINSLFEESITCYKAAAYRASFLFSFLAFQSVIKERILKAEMPKNHNPHTWGGLQNNLRNEDRWDLEVIESIKINNEGKRLFNITQDLRDQVLYWKGRRNDCAHSKPNTISYSHVESFWLFLISNLPKFFVDGGFKALLQKIDKYFDQNYTNKNADFKDIIQNVPFAVNEEDADSFAKEFYEIINLLDNEDYFDRGISFYNELIKLNSPISIKIIEVIKQAPSKTYLEEAYLGTYPEHLSLFYSKSEDVRYFWRTKLENMHTHKFTILAALLRNGLINEDKEEVFEYFIKNIYAERYSLYSDVIVDLKSHGYFEKYQKLVFAENLIQEFVWANDKGRFTIAEHLDHIGLNKEIVNKINLTFSNVNHPFSMRKELSNYFSDSIKKEEFKRISESMGYEPPERLFS
ncbi:hypothetical protein O3S73_008745 [Bacillus altitudinis]|uniref:hypothetical protein n=1 Tax=Bacillus altitudinis TaxID=293387 RepID=UPI000D6B5573|nr:hypothetical protein [Bacillus altitudinis]MDR7669054.1 hypothetical protein [Bacillus altitudinis]PWN86093.1 hypothetical protein CTM99_01760 [Bacillus altitudinis]